MNDSKKIFTPEQEEKLAKIANRLEEDGVLLNLFYVTSRLITESIPLLDRYEGERIKSFYEPTKYSLKLLSRVFIAVHLLAALYLEDNQTSALDQLRDENNREINRISEIVEKED